MDGRNKVVMSPLAQARFCAIQVVNALERDPQLVQPDGRHQGKLAFPWGHGVVFTRITRKQFDAAGLGDSTRRLSRRRRCRRSAGQAPRP